MVQKILAQLILKKQIQKQTGITKQILPGDVSKAESKAEFAIESLKNRGNINVNNLTKGDLEFLAEDIVNPLKNAEKTIVKQSAEILPFRFKRSFAEELADASKKGDFKRMRGIMSVDPKFKQVIESLKRSKAEEKAYQEMVGPKKLIPDRDVIPFQSPEVQKLSPEEKLARTTLTEDQYKDVLKKGKTLDDVIYAQDFYGDTADDVITKITKGEKFPFAGGGIAGMLGERPGYNRGSLVKKFIQKFITKDKDFSPKEFVDRRNFFMNIIGQSEKQKNKRMLEDILGDNEKLKAKPSDIFPSDDEIRLELEKRLQPILNKNRKLNADGGRQNFKIGRRAFLKMLAGTGAGIAGLKTGITGLGGKKVATEVAKEAVTTSGGTPPPYFFNLVKKIKNLGDDVTSKSANQPREKVTKYKDYELTEDLTTGEQTIQKVKLGNDGPQYYDEVLAEETYMNYKPGKGQADETTGKVADEYTEDTSYLRTSGPQKGEIVDTVDGVGDDVIQEGTVFEDDITDFATKKVRTKKAGGGVAYMLGQ